MAGFVCIVCWTKLALSRFLNALKIVALTFNFILVESGQNWKMFLPLTATSSQEIYSEINLPEARLKESKKVKSELIIITCYNHKSL